jgi:hypothetical protein
MALGYRLLMASSPPDDTVELFAGGLVWITETGIWSPQTERVGIALLRSFAFACTGRSLIGEVTAILVGKDELIEAQAALYIALLFKWDALLVHEGTQTFFRVSHHGIVIATSSSATMIDSLRSGLMDGGWRVRDR